MSKSVCTSLGVIVARVQVDDLHEGHLDLFKEVSDTNTAILVVIGLSPCKCTTNNPLDYDTRRRLILSHFPSAKVAYINDVGDDVVWSKNLDTIVSKYSENYDSTTLYGSRDSFIKAYKGIYPTKRLIQRVIISGSAIRKSIAERSRDTIDFRAGAIWYALNQYPRAIPTVDIAVIDMENKLILLCRKQHEVKYRLIGGFVQPGETYEQAASRELEEETGLFVNPECLKIQKSFFIDDWRYKSEVDKITTTLYVATSWNGKPKPNDDIVELRWMPFDAFTLSHIIYIHQKMYMYLLPDILEV